MEEDVLSPVSNNSNQYFFPHLLNPFIKILTRLCQCKLITWLQNVRTLQTQLPLVRHLTNQITWVSNDEGLTFSQTHKTPFLYRLQLYLQQPSTCFYFSAISTIGLLAGKNHFLIALILYSLCFVYNHHLYRKKNYFKLSRCTDHLLHNSHLLGEFLRRIRAPRTNRTQNTLNERAEWISDLLLKLWPYVNSLLQHEIDKQKLNSVGVSIGHGHEIHFERFTLGDKPPVITSVHVDLNTYTREDEIVIDLKMLYFGNCLLSFTKRTFLLFNVKAGVKDIYFRSAARLRLRPLLNKPPYFGGCTFSLLDPPILDYEGINLANLADNKLIKNFLVHLISQLMVNPNQLFYPLSKDPEIIRLLKAPMASGICVFQVIEAEELPILDNENHFLSNFCNPFCIIRIAGKQYKTPIAFSTHNPYWDCSYFAPVHDLNEFIKVEVFDKDAITTDDYIGAVEFCIKDVALDENINGLDKWVPISRSSSGALHFRCTYMQLHSQFNLEEMCACTRLLHSSAIKYPICLLSVYIYSLHLPAHLATTCIPLLQLKHNGQTQESRPIHLGKNSSSDINLNGNRSFVTFNVEQFFQVTCSDTSNENVELNVLNVSGFNLKSLQPLRVFSNRMLGSCNISVAKVLQQQITQTGELRLELPLFNRTGFIPRKLCGKLRVCVKLALCQVSTKLYRNLQYPAYVKANKEQLSNNSSLLKRISQQFRYCLQHPFQTLDFYRFSKPSLLATSSQVRVITEQPHAPPTHLTLSHCHVKVRFLWLQRKKLHVQVLSIYNISSHVASSRFVLFFSLICPSTTNEKSQTSDTTPNNLVKNIPKVQSTANASNKNLSDKKSFNTQVSDVDKSLINNQLSKQTQNTRHFYFNRSVNWACLNDMLCFSINSKVHLDAYVLHIELFAVHSRTLFCYTRPLQLVNTCKVSVPLIIFRSEHIERWYELEKKQNSKSSLISSTSSLS